jgi:hypothetical protein
MNVTRNISIALFLIGIYATNPFGSDASSQESSGRRKSPPPEAYTACEGKSAGDAAQFVSPRGETVTGTCQQEGDRLVLRPDRANARSGGRRQGPPPEAYSACDGKSAGDAAQFVSPRGETVTGTCEQEGDRLVLRPDCAKGSAGGRPMNRASD